MPDTRPILLVEDNPDDVLLTLRAFKKAHIANQVIVARDGVEALDYLFGTGQWEGRDVTELPALMLLDLKIPKIDGIQVLERVRADERTRLCRVVVLTSSSEEQDLVKSYTLFANSYIRKPVDFEQFVQVAGQLGVYWLLLNEAPLGR
jgi:two-component system response regulator